MGALLAGGCEMVATVGLRQCQANCQEMAKLCFARKRAPTLFP